MLCSPNDEKGRNLLSSGIQVSQKSFNQFKFLSLLTGLLVAYIVELTRSSFLWIINFEWILSLNSNEEADSDNSGVMGLFGQLSIGSAVSLLPWEYAVFYFLLRAVLRMNLVANGNGMKKEDIMGVFRYAFFVGSFLGAATTLLLLPAPQSHICKLFTIGTAALAVVSFVQFWLGLRYVDDDRSDLQEPLLPTTRDDQEESDTSNDKASTSSTRLRCSFFTIIGFLGFLIPFVNLGLSLFVIGFKISMNKEENEAPISIWMDLGCCVTTVLLVVFFCYAFVTMVTVGKNLCMKSSDEDSMDSTVSLFEDYFFTTDGCLALPLGMSVCATFSWVAIMSWLQHQFRLGLLLTELFHVLAIAAGCRLALWLSRCIHLRQQAVTKQPL